MAGLSFKVAGQTVNFQTTSSKLMAQVRAVWAPALIPWQAKAEHEIVADEQNRLWVNGEQTFYDDQSPELLAQLQWFLVFDALAPRSGAVHLHAAATIFEELGLLFSGSSGSGKSTLTKQCLLAGASYITDDCLVAENDKLWGVGRTIHFDPIPSSGPPPSYLLDCDFDTFQVTKKRGMYTFPLWHDGYAAIPELARGDHLWVVVQLARGQNDYIEPLDSVARLGVIHEAVITSGREYSGELGFGPTYRLTWNDPQKAFEMLRNQLRKDR